MKMHDSTLTLVQLDWATGELSFKLLSYESEEVVTIVGKDVKHFSCTREWPWGRSVSVNQLKIDQKEGFSLLRIEMQSGDELLAKAGSFTADRK